jgi:hypothetical protein
MSLETFNQRLETAADRFEGHSLLTDSVQRVRELVHIAPDKKFILNRRIVGKGFGKLPVQEELKRPTELIYARPTYDLSRFVDIQDFGYKPSLEVTFDFEDLKDIRGPKLIKDDPNIEEHFPDILLVLDPIDIDKHLDQTADGLAAADLFTPPETRGTELEDILQNHFTDIFSKQRYGTLEQTTDTGVRLVPDPRMISERDTDDKIDVITYLLEQSSDADPEPIVSVQCMDIYTKYGNIEVADRIE